MSNYNTANWIGQQIRYNRQAKKREEKERQEYNISWECDKISEKGNKTIYIIALILMIVPILFAILWWGVVTQTNDLGTFFGGLGILYILLPILVIGFILIIVFFSIKSTCTHKTPKNSV
jgi:uncharacterized BrkB/YihY/UPF0761 family membrane protein